jgi:hypothetical protein
MRMVSGATRQLQHVLYCAFTRLVLLRLLTLVWLFPAAGVTLAGQ